MEAGSPLLCPSLAFCLECLWPNSDHQTPPGKGKGSQIAKAFAFQLLVSWPGQNGWKLLRYGRFSLGPTVRECSLLPIVARRVWQQGRLQSRER